MPVYNVKVNSVMVPSGDGTIVEFRRQLYKSLLSRYQPIRYVPATDYTKYIVLAGLALLIVILVMRRT